MTNRSSAQCVWKSSTKIGIGAAKDSKGAWYTVARYSGPGNVVGQKPYWGIKYWTKRRLLNEISAWGSWEGTRWTFLASADLIPSLIHAFSSKVAICITTRIPHIRLRVTNYVKQIDLLNQLLFPISHHVNNLGFLLVIREYQQADIRVFVCHSPDTGTLYYPSIRLM